MLTREHFTPTIPTIDGILSAAKATLMPIEDGNLTDHLGIAGTCLVFPEFGNIAHELAILEVVGHGIDNIIDEGPNYRGHRGDHEPNIIIFNHAYSQLLQATFAHNPSHSGLILKNSLGFLSQAAQVENEAHSQKMSLEKQTEYRELINAIWVRMMVSYGCGLQGGAVDPIGKNLVLNYSELAQLYKPYIEGQNLVDLPGGNRNRILFLWTMEVQRIFDLTSRKYNSTLGLPQLSGRETYFNQAVQAGVSPAFLTSVSAFVSTIKRAESLVRNPGKLAPRILQQKAAERVSLGNY